MFRVGWLLPRALANIHTYADTLQGGTLVFPPYFAPHTPLSRSHLLLPHHVHHLLRHIRHEISLRVQLKRGAYSDRHVPAQGGVWERRMVVKDEKGW